MGIKKEFFKAAGASVLAYLVRDPDMNRATNILCKIIRWVNSFCLMQTGLISAQDFYITISFVQYREQTSLSDMTTILAVLKLLDWIHRCARNDVHSIDCCRWRRSQCSTVSLYFPRSSSFSIEIPRGRNLRS